MTAQETLRPGDVVAGKYRVARELGAGGMGVVFEAVHLRLGHSVAIKLLREEYRANAELVSRFEREARAAARLHSPNVARILDVDALPDGAPVTVMELLRGHDLAAELEARGSIPVAEAVDYVLQACNAVSEAHGLGIVHRDLKPQNLFLAQEGDEVRVKLLDFGISKVMGDERGAITRTHTALGTPQYMSPEQIRSARLVDHRTDVWALGVILYELVGGRSPFTGDTPAAVIAAITADVPEPLGSLVPWVPEGLSDAVMRALEKAPERRFDSVAEFARAIAPWGTQGVWAPPRHSLTSLSSVRSELEPTMAQPVVAVAPTTPVASSLAASPGPSSAGMSSSLVGTPTPITAPAPAPDHPHSLRPKAWRLPVAGGLTLLAVVAGVLLAGPRRPEDSHARSEPASVMVSAAVDDAPLPSATSTVSQAAASVIPLPAPSSATAAASAVARPPAVRGARPRVAAPASPRASVTPPATPPPRPTALPVHL